MKSSILKRPTLLAFAALTTLGTSLLTWGCSNDAAPDGAGGAGGGAAGGRRYVLGTVNIAADGNRMSYAQIIDELGGHYDAADGIEAAGNAVFLASGSSFFYGLAEEPTWVKYSTDGGKFEEVGRLSFAKYGLSYTDFSNVIVDEETAVSVITSAYVAVVWNPKTFEIVGEIDVSHLQHEGYDLEGWTMVAHDGLVYLPGRWANWTDLAVEQLVSMTILDPKKLEVVGVAEDDRCGSGGRITFDADGYGYVMGDGRNQSMQTFAALEGEESVPNCLLRIAPGQTDFEEDYFFEIPELTGGLDSMDELEAPAVDAGLGFTLMKYEELIPEDADRANFEHWSVPAYKKWRITLGDEPKAEEVNGANYTVVGFTSSAVDGKLYTSESADGSESTVFEIDPATNTATKKFTTQGYFSALLPLE
ncbi:MAG TPA: DUF4374 domain-containing protein [Polyangiaceae bacterium]|nr:DUF4374 domain-containing protein [Polyangiaceae bacterium]